MHVEIRPATTADAAAVARIFNQGIEERAATFETRPRNPREIARQIAAAGPVPFLVAERAGEVVGWARLGAYSARACYAGVGEASVYLDRGGRGQGIGRRLVEALADAAQREGYWKMLALVFPTNAVSVGLFRATGFREVGVHRRHGQLDGEWRDVLVAERLLQPRTSAFTPRSARA